MICDGRKPEAEDPTVLARVQPLPNPASVSQVGLLSLGYSGRVVWEVLSEEVTFDRDLQVAKMLVLGRARE